MKSKEFLWRVCLSIYAEAFRKAKPSLDFRRLYRMVLKGDRRLRKDWFLLFYLPEEEFGKIVKRACKRNKLNAAEERIVRNEVYLGCSPTSNRERWLERWLGKEPAMKRFTNLDELFEEDGGAATPDKPQYGENGESL